MFSINNNFRPHTCSVCFSSMSHVSGILVCPELTDLVLICASFILRE